MNNVKTYVKIVVIFNLQNHLHLEKFCGYLNCGNEKAFESLED